ncbi:hypothetical protein BDY24DRAFT_384623 [Mrakia frigida]|uniref:uncharacterized protein n=1 Tax=Mrakia frigida TaxID=29902 RepID=UPI003FCC1970
MSFSSDNSLFSSANAARSPPPAPAPSSSNSRPIDVVLNFLPTTFPSDPTSLQALLSSTFLVTTVSLPVLSPKAANLNHASSPSPSRHRPSSNLAPSSPPSSLRRVSANHLSVPMGLSASTPSSPTTRPLDLTRSRPSSIFSNSDSNPFSLSSEAILAHILPDNSPPLLPMLLDKFMKSTLANFPSVGMIVLPESILASRPSVFDHDPLDPEDEDEEQEELEGLSSEGSSSSHASSSSARNRFPAQNGRSLDASPSRLPTPPIISLLLTSSLRPPLLLPPSLKPSSRRGSSSSSSSMTFRSSTLNPSTPPPSSLQLLAPPAEISTIRTFIPSPESITFIPRPIPRPAQIPLSSSWGSGGDKLLNSLALTTDGLPSTRRHGAYGFEVPQLEKSSSSSGSDGGGIRTPGGGSSVRSDATAEDASVAGSPKGRGGATLKNTKFGDLGRGGKSSGVGGESWISRFFGSMGRKGKARVIT